ncbi:glycoside hydrolase family 57 protein [Thiobacillus sedimenti]|uniref:Glycoside hydrolase family 57 protein n=1 Tax=Thiobacillus sedimenti TaxID=3110231 RepID=A0ABZ1CGT2_9PROT|nr:glycoside hydrolase family 57 protein [Thiobacillus sp. SCUT-2]WRS38582.1 glycoside hydrolase family 57 protein [Thiobacillus sp. SCUT-2]
MAKSLNVVLCWHMHQPYYREGLKGAYHLPWVYLHGIKDYSDMAAHLERHPDMRAVVNFAPVLLEQLDDYARQLDALLKHGKPTQDHLLNLLSGIERIPSDRAGRIRIIQDCQRCHGPRMIDPHPPFRHLLDMVGAGGETPVRDDLKELPGYLSEQYFLDLLTWYHLAWLGHSLRQLPLAKRLTAQEGGYSSADRHELLHLMQHCMAGLIPRYRALAERGQVELSMTPYGHPIVPLLNDFANLRDALPDAPAPEAPAYPGGAERSRWHLEHGAAVFEHYFGRKPAGVWLSEGGVSEDALAQLDAMGFAWTASGEGVWRNSCAKSGCPDEALQNKRTLFSPSHVDGHTTRLFFRDDGLSDLIGFKYSDWHADDAVGDFVQHLENIAAFFGKEANRHVVSVILDGENAWEYYPDNGHFFLDGLYNALAGHATLKVGTFAELATSLPAVPLKRLAAGSWVYGSFSTWIGADDKNRGWDYLVAAKHAYDSVVAAKKLGPDQLALATRQLAVCEGSDWFWWFGDYNPARSVSDFEQLYRTQLRELYRLLGVAPPALLDVPLSSGGGWAENAGTMRRNA